MSIFQKLDDLKSKELSKDEIKESHKMARKHKNNIKGK